MTENLPKDGVQSRQAVFVRCCLNTIMTRGTEPMVLFVIGKKF